MKRLALALGSAAGIVLLGLLCFLRFGVVPIKDFTERGWFFGEVQGKSISEEEVSSLVRRARIDQFIHPIAKTDRVLGIVLAEVRPPDDLYLIFYGSLANHSAVIYRCSKKDRSLLWKSVDYNSP